MVERCVRDAEVGSSNLPAPTTYFVARASCLLWDPVPQHITAFRAA